MIDTIDDLKDMISDALGCDFDDVNVLILGTTVKITAKNCETDQFLEELEDTGE